MSRAIGWKSLQSYCTIKNYVHGNLSNYVSTHCSFSSSWPRLMGLPAAFFGKYRTATLSSNASTNRTNQAKCPCANPHFTPTAKILVASTGEKARSPVCTVKFKATKVPSTAGEGLMSFTVSCVQARIRQ